MTDDTQAFVGEIRWTPGTYATSKNLRMSFSYVGRTSSHWFCTGTSQSPVKWNYDMEEACVTPVYCGISNAQLPSNEPKKPNSTLTLLSYVNTPFGCTQANNFQPVELSLQQRFQAIISLFHNYAAPAEYTAFPDQ